MYTKSANVEVYRPAVSPNEAGKVFCSDGTVAVTAAQIALNAVVGLCVLPAGCIPLDFILVESDLDTGTALVQSVGVKDPAADDLIASTNFITASTVGRSGGSARATTFPDALVAVSSDPAVGANAWSGDRVIAVKTTTGGVLNVQATGTITSSGVNVTAGDTVTVNGTAYTFRSDAPDAEGEVLIGTNAAETLDNLKLAVNRTDPDTNDGVNYKIAAAHTTVIATTNTDTVQTFEAIAAGATPNSYTLARSAATLTVSVGEFGGGVTAVPLQAGTIRGILTYRAAEYGA